MTTLREAAELAVTMLRVGSPEYDAGDALEVLEAALAGQCQCGDRAAAQCPGEWEPGCDLGNNPKYAKRVELAEPGSLMIAAQQFLEWNRAQIPPPVAVGFELAVFEAVKKAYPFPPQRKPLRRVTYVCPVCAASLERQE